MINLPLKRRLVVATVESVLIYERNTHAYRFVSYAKKAKLAQLYTLQLAYNRYYGMDRYGYITTLKLKPYTNRSLLYGIL